MARRKTMDEARIRYGIGEWYGKSFTALTQEERIAFTHVRAPGSQICVPRSTEDNRVPCSKKGGVCSLRLYQSGLHTNHVEALPVSESFCTLCPHRFKADNGIFKWVSEEILGHLQPLIVTEVGFLIREQINKSIDDTVESSRKIELSENGNEEQEDVGQIDYVLMHPDRENLKWCALELQAVYFSGPKMSEEYESIRDCPEGKIPFPVKNRRPDYRSSGPKRLMPQLQIKVPTLRRWGKKMAVVVDRGFFNALGKMDNVPDISNCDIIWFIVNYKESAGQIQLIRDAIQYTTLERAVEGLTAGRPVTLGEFEHRISAKLDKIPRSRKKATSAS